jgi:hypothetical protein
MHAFLFQVKIPRPGEVGWSVSGFLLQIYEDFMVNSFLRTEPRYPWHIRYYTIALLSISRLFASTTHAPHEYFTSCNVSAFCVSCLYILMRSDAYVPIW